MQTNKKEKFDIISWSLKYPALSITVISILVAIGGFAAIKMSRNEFPVITGRVGVILAWYPGASSKDVAEQVAKPLNDFLSSYKEVNKEKTVSFSRDGEMQMVVELTESMEGVDIDQFWNKLRASLPQFQTNLPRGVLPLMLKSDFGETSTMLLSVSSKGHSNMELSRYIDTIENELRVVDWLARISRVGELTDEILVDLDTRKMQQYRISTEQVITTLQNVSSIIPVSIQKGEKKDLPIHILPNGRSVDDLGAAIIRSGEGRTVKVRDIATLTRSLPEDQPYITSDGVRCIVISLEMEQRGQIVKFGEQVEQKLNELRKRLPEDVSITELTSQPKVVNKTILLFWKEFFFTLLIVFLVLRILLTLKVTIIAITSIPLSIAATLGTMYITGSELNTVTIAALFVALGIVVDDTIVIIDGYLEKLNQGFNPKDAALLSTLSLRRPVSIATLIIAASFLPLKFFLTGLAADFIDEFPGTIIIALLYSLLISILIVPYLSRRFIRPETGSFSQTRIPATRLGKIQLFFNRCVNLSLASPYKTISFGSVIVFCGCLLMALLPIQLFPFLDRDQFAIEVNLRPGCSLKESGKVVEKIQPLLSNDARVKSVTSAVGGSLPRYHPTYAQKFPAPNRSQTLVNTTSVSATEELIAELRQSLSDSLSNGYIAMKQLSMLAAAFPIEVRISGGDIPTLLSVGAKIVELGKQQPGVILPVSDFEGLQETASLNVNADEAARFDLNRSSIGRLLNTTLAGQQVSEVWEGSYRIPVKLRIAHSVIGGISDVTVPSSTSGANLVIARLAKVRPEWQPAQIVHRNGVLTLTVGMDLQPGQYSAKLLKLMKPKIDAIVSGTGLKISYGGEQELQDENLTKLIQALLVSIILICTFLLYHFGHPTQGILSLSTILYAIPGVGLGLYFMGLAITFPAIVGLFAVCAIVVRNGIILIDRADEHRKHEGKTAVEAALLSAQSRVRPILLTTAAAAIGVSTLVFWGDSIWSPLATVIFFGLLFSMILTLLVLPALYAVIFSKKPAKKSEVLPQHTSNLSLR